MRVLDEHRFGELCDCGEIAHSGCRYIEGIKIGLHSTGTVLKAPSYIIATLMETPLMEIEVKDFGDTVLMAPLMEVEVRGFGDTVAVLVQFDEVFVLSHR